MSSSYLLLLLMLDIAGDLVASLFQVVSGMCGVMKNIKSNDGTEYNERIGIRKAGGILVLRRFLLLLFYLSYLII